MTPTISDQFKTATRPLHLVVAEDNPDDLTLTLRELKKSELNLKIETVETESGFALDQNAFCCFSVDPNDWSCPGSQE